MRLLMMGTGEFALPTFRCLYDTPHEVVGLFTQPERTGKGHHRGAANPLKELALARGTPVFQPVNVNVPEMLEQLRALAADVFIVAAYGQILSNDLLSIPRIAAINVHASLLPKYRGAAPINYAIWKGEQETGVSIIQVLPQLDAGPIFAMVRTPIGARETAGELEERLSQLAIPEIPGVLEKLAAGRIDGLPQNPQLVTRAPKLKKEQGEIHWVQTRDQIDRQVRALQPWPNAFTFVHSDGKPPQRVQVLEVSPFDDPVDAGSSSGPGAVVVPRVGIPANPPVAVSKKRLVVQTADGPLEILRLQPDGKRVLTAIEYLNGCPLKSGDRLGSK